MKMTINQLARIRHATLERFHAGECSIDALINLAAVYRNHGLESNAAALTKRIKHWSAQAVANEAAQAVAT